jgi:hypothetical protein
MLLLTISLSLVTLLFPGSPNAQPAPSGGRVTGRVLDAASGAPVVDARVVLLPAERPRVAGPMAPPPQAVTNQDGVYLFDGIAASRYRLQVEKTGFAGASGAAVLIVAAGQVTTAPDVRLDKGGAISGRVVDGRGEPLPEVIVSAVHPPSGYVNGRGIPIGQAGQTNDLGEFRISGLPAGEYYVAARPRPRPPFEQPSTSGGTTLVSTYYPGALEMSGARPITVAPGETVSGLQFTMMSADAFEISGLVVDQMDRPIGGAMVMAMPEAADPLGAHGSARTQPDGTFKLGHLTRGSYRLVASVPVTMSAGRSTVSSGGMRGGVVWGTATTSSPAGGASGPAMVQVSVEGDVAGVKLVVRQP